jgi:hypothetical protein
MSKFLKSIGRYILYLLAFTGFVLLGGILVLYSLGYRYNFTDFKPYKIGILSISTKPAGANVYLDGKLQKKKTPLDFHNLLPKTYSVKIEKDGFQSFEAKVVVQAGLVSRIDNLFLVSKKLEPKKISKEPSANFLPSPDGQKVAYALTQGENSGIWIFDLSAHTFTKLFPLQKSLLEAPLKAVPVSWSESSQTLLIESDNKALYSVRVDNPTEIRRFNLLSYKKIIWKDEEPFFLSDDNYLISHFGEVTESLPNVFDATFFGGQFYLIKKSDLNVVLEKRPGLKERAEEILKLPANARLTFYPQTNQMIMLRSAEGQLFWLKTEGSPSLVPIAAKAKSAIFDGKTLIVWDGLELNAYNFPFEEKKLIAKLSETTLSHLSFFEENEILTQENSQILIRSLYGGSSFSVISAPETSVFGIKDKTLFYSSKGLIYSILLQPK